MESKTHGPSFTVSLRGYDRMEVDEYLDSLAEALGQVEQAEDRNRAMQAHVDRLNARIADLEERIRAEVPRSGAVLGERISILLRAAEETAADTVNRSEATAAEILDKAHLEVESAEDQARGAVLRGEEQARRVESAARAEAAEIVAEAEGRASARTRQIEQWAEQVVSHTRAEEARMLDEQQEKREAAEAEIQALTDQRDAVAATLAELRETLGQALGRVGTVTATPKPIGPVEQPEVTDLQDDLQEDAEVAAPDEPTDRAEAEAEVEAEAAVDPDEMPWPAAFDPVAEERDAEEDDSDAGEGDRTGEMIRLVVEPEAADDEESDDTAERDEFDTKFEAWVSGTGEPKHFRRL